MVIQEFVFQGDYGYRDSYLPLFKDLLNEYGNDSLTGFTFYVNNIPYKLELYFSFVFENSIEAIRDLKERCQLSGLWHSPNITISTLLNEAKNRRFDIISSVTFEDFSLIYSGAFAIPIKQEFYDKGYNWHNKLNGKSQIFISYSHKQKKDVFDLISMINRLGPSVWVDEQQIDFGENILQSVTKGINDCPMSIVWITNDFINSKFPLHELSTLLHKNIMEDTRVICIVDFDVDILNLREKGFQIDTIKFHKRVKDETVADTFNGIKTSISNYLNIW
ncbi:hypothetical protein NCCP2222_02270 [Sporosarcina sp. NCCP-2222]|uniref:toll/interleukin-1 receptor domain-containing protein n=1 Tax=Sporosarcina sp. NCCP-2222 TaxID=2935073 RepID=UPI002088AA29|nr:toll/interleukin-1 receptor domain-containing protein [Sporosarcina sp. NCCP-2222]GKV54280.1 hypothetical protein NCCP2222_02270 [Sporosarcina sp. NCCP-2222]